MATEKKIYIHIRKKKMNRYIQRLKFDEVYCVHLDQFGTRSGLLRKWQRNFRAYKKDGFS